MRLTRVRETRSPRQNPTISGRAYENLSITTQDAPFAAHRVTAAIIDGARRELGRSTRIVFSISLYYSRRLLFIACAARYENRTTISLLSLDFSKRIPTLPMIYGVDRASEISRDPERLKCSWSMFIYCNEAVFVAGSSMASLGTREYSSL